jgi:hypothetical protein
MKSMFLSANPESILVNILLRLVMICRAKEFKGLRVEELKS